MEAPAPLVFAAVFVMSGGANAPIPLFFAGIWALHYGNRALYFPLAMKPRPSSRMALVVVVSGMGVCAVHGWLYATWIAAAPHLTLGWLADPRLWIGLGLYFSGFVLNVHSDSLLRGLRGSRPDDGAYVIPQGGGFRWVSSPHYLGEILAWSGLALATWCPGGLFVLTVTLANLVPRALATHRWYLKRFEDYPSERKALIPWVL